MTLDEECSVVVTGLGDFGWRALGSREPVNDTKSKRQTSLVCGPAPRREDTKRVRP
jgi:hypothetical protein